MALVTVQDCKDYLRIEHTAEDVMLAAWLTQAFAAVQAYVRRPVTALERTFILGEPTQATYVVQTQIFVPIYPVATDPAVQVTDGDDTALVEDVDYRMDHRTGEITAVAPLMNFATWPYTIIATVGLSEHPDYATDIEPAINGAILDVVADRYQRRNPAATSEATGGGVSVSYGANVGLPERVKAMLAPFVMARAR